MKSYKDPRVIKEKHPFDNEADINNFIYSFIDKKSAYVGGEEHYFIVMKANAFPYSSALHALYPGHYSSNHGVVLKSFEDFYEAGRELEKIRDCIRGVLMLYISFQKELLNPEIQYY